MSVRQIVALWRRVRRSGRDLDLAGYAAVAAGAVMLIATGIVGPTLDAQQHRHADAERHAAR